MHNNRSFLKLDKQQKLGKLYCLSTDHTQEGSNLFNLFITFPVQTSSKLLTSALSYHL